MPVLTRPELDHGYLTTPQPQLNNRELPYPRGKAMGGSTNLNYMGELKSEENEAVRLYLVAQIG